ncbi:MAG: glycosyl hydrolase [Acidobacteria bacterium]|nr:glycosyl hydrolase [Acidobacteriota bacterium]
MRFRPALAAITGVIVAAALLPGSAQQASAPSASPQTTTPPSPLETLEWRSVGPDRGGRSIAVSGVKGRPREAYFGAVGGGLWKTTDGGENWMPLTDGLIKSASVGAVAVAETSPDVVFIGMGESCIRGNILPGDGVYKSSDAGKTWTHVGFSDSQAISRVRIHPTNPDVIFVASFGKYGAPSAERGVFKSTDGGKSWKKTLFRDEKTGAVDISIDRKDPNVIYAALWEAYRVEYQMSSGGPGSGLFKSTDGGDTWTEITRAPGLPAGVVGRIGVSVSGADSSRVYALIENEKGGLFSSDDAGKSWTMVNENRNIRQRAFYYTHVAADPVVKDTVYLLNVNGYRSTDGGKTMVDIGQGTHGDHHDLWIDPDDPKHLVIGNDGGGSVSTQGGQAAPGAPAPAWTAQDYPTAQYYHVATTTHIPYHLCGAQQDGSTVCISSEAASPVGAQIAAGRRRAQAGDAQGAGGGGGGRGGGGRGGRGGAPEMYGAGGSENGTIAPDPKDMDVIFAGGNNGSFLTRLNRRTGEQREVNPYPRIFSGEPSSAVKERWQWSTPLIFSPVDPNVLYTSSQHVWKTTTQGQTWAKISGDLTRHDPKTMGPSGGPITGDMNGPEIYAVVFALGPGKTDVNVLWAGSDDGLVHLTRDGGKTWAKVTPKEMPDFGRVSQIDASAFDPGTAYVSVRKPLLDDLAPYIFRTHDFGKSWTRIVNGLGPKDYVNVVREDRKRKGLLYAGTQHGFYVSFNDGGAWQPLSLNLPDVPVADAWIEDNSIAIATHGRSFYVLDDLAVLRQSADATGTANAFLFQPADAVRGAGGATLSYLLKTPAQKLTLEVLDAGGQVVFNAVGAPPPQRGQGRQGGAPGAEEGGGGGRGRGGPPAASLQPGLNRVNWGLTYPGATSFPGMVLWGASTNGPSALPGNYQVRLTVDGNVQTQPLVVRRHPLRSATEADLKEQFDLAIRIRDKVSEANTAVVQIRNIRQQLTGRTEKSSDLALKAAGERLAANLTSVEEEIYQTRNQSGQDPLNFPIRINNRIAALNRVVNAGDGKPIGSAYEIFTEVTAELKVQTDRLQQVLEKDVAAFNAEARRAGVAPIEVSK